MNTLIFNLLLIFDGVVIMVLATTISYWIRIATNYICKPKPVEFKPLNQEYPDWLFIQQPIEVTFDHKSFLVYDRETELWHLEKRHSDPVEVEDDYNRYIRQLRKREEWIELEYEEIQVIGSPIRHR